MQLSRGIGMRDVVIVSAARTAIGKFGGTLKNTSSAELGSVAIGSALERAGLEGRLVDEVLLGNVIQAGQGQNPARQASIKAGIPVEVPACTVNMVCGSGLKAVDLAVDKIRCGGAEVVVAGGMECMSQAPFGVGKARWGLKMGDYAFQDLLLRDGLVDAFYGYHMGMTAENVAEKCEVGRLEQDEFAEESQLKALRAIQDGTFEREIVPVRVVEKKGKEVVFREDESPRSDSTCEALGKLEPCFKDDGTVTAGNASGINDGAAVLVLASWEKARTFSPAPMAFVRGVESVGVDPRYMGLGPIAAIRKVLDATGLELADVDLIELNEAFAAQAIAVARELKLDPARMNVNGGAIALGHPIGASGARILVTLLYEMERRSCRFGLASLCVGGGMGIAAVIERPVRN
jgi:acetyl-CoA C-acetyltransferase